MILKALLPWAGLRAVPHFHDMRIHDALNDDMAMIAGLQCFARQSQAISETMTSDPADTGRIKEGVDRMRNLLAEVRGVPIDERHAPPDP